MAPLLVIAAFVIGVALGVYFGRKSAYRRLDLDDLYNAWAERADLAFYHNAPNSYHDDKEEA